MVFTWLSLAKLPCVLLPSMRKNTSWAITAWGGPHRFTERCRRPKGISVVHATFMQEDVILDTMTVREALTFAAQLKLPGSMSNAEKEQRAMDIAELLNLQKSLDNVVGSAMLKGISGGSWPARGHVCSYELFRGKVWARC